MASKGLCNLCIAVILAAAPASTNAQEDEAGDTVKPDFSESFAPYIDSGPTKLSIPAGAVDISTFKPKLDPKKPKPQPTLSGRTVRSLGTGVASYYGKRFHGRLTANGERFNMRAMTAAHKTLPFGTKVRV
ncbi:MAG: RlpA-like double-psi beta-barrel domain-containing protein, partial [Pseudomonadota bacterium]